MTDLNGAEVCGNCAHHANGINDAPCSDCNTTDQNHWEPRRAETIACPHCAARDATIAALREQVEEARGALEQTLRAMEFLPFEPEYHLEARRRLIAGINTALTQLTGEGE